MSEHGFIDRESGVRRKADRIDALVGLILPCLDLSALSPEARRLLAELRCGDPAREHRAVAEVHRLMDADPLPSEPTL